MRDREAVLAGARRLAKRRAPKFDATRFLAAIERGAYIGGDLESVPAAQRDLVLPVLRAIVGERSGAVRLNVARALLEFGDPRGCEVLIECLQSKDSELRHGALDRLIWLGLDNWKRDRELPIAKDALLVALEPSLADPNLWARQRALQFISGLRSPRALDRLALLLNDHREDVRADAAIALGRLGHDRGAVTVIEKMLATPGCPKRYHLVRALGRLCESGESSIGARATAIAVRFVRQNLTAGWQAANDVANCLEAVAAAQAPEEADLLREVMSSSVEGWVRGEALKRLAQLEGQQGVVRLLSALSDAELREPALKGLASLAGGTAEPAVLSALTHEIKCGGAENISDLVQAFLAHGGLAVSLAEEVVRSLEPATAMTVDWLRKDIGPREAAAKLQPACDAFDPSPATIDKFEAEWRKRPDATRVVYELLGGQWNRLTAIFCKTVESPADHAQLVRDLSDITGDQFVLDDVAQTVVSNEELRLSFVHRGGSHSFSVENQGRWLNLRGVLKDLNLALQGVRVTERFITFDIGPVEVAVVAFVLPDKFFPVARELGIRLESVAEII
jgi:HEAT repeat protein